MKNTEPAKIRELLVSLEISEEFQRDFLDELLTGVYPENLGELIEVVGTAIQIYEGKLENDEHPRTAEELRNYRRGFYAGGVNVPFPKEFIVAAELRRQLAEVFAVDQAYIIERMGEFKGEVRAGIKRTGQVPVSPNWERRFVNFFLETLSVRELDEQSVADSEPEVVSPDREGQRKVALLTAQLLRNFSMPKTDGYPTTWRPRQHVFNALRARAYEYQC